MDPITAREFTSLVVLQHSVSSIIRSTFSSARLLELHPTPMADLTPNSQETSAYVRLAKPSETSAIAAVLTRAFARDPVANWLGGVRALVPAYHKADADNDGDDSDDDSNARHTLANLRRFELGVIKRVETSGLIVVVVEKEGKARAEGEGEGEGEGVKERILGCALWMKPATSKVSFPRMFLRVARLVWCWGLGGIKRMVFDWRLPVGKIHDEVFDARGLNCLDTWHLLQVAVDPAYEGKGYCSLLLRDGFQRASGKPIYLESTTPRSRDIYAHLGFEVGKEHRFGVGSVDEMGIAAKGELAVGWPCFFMTKWENP